MRFRVAAGRQGPTTRKNHLIWSETHCATRPGISPRYTHRVGSRSESEGPEIRGPRNLRGNSCIRFHHHVRDVFKSHGQKPPNWRTHFMAAPVRKRLAGGSTATNFWQATALGRDVRRETTRGHFGPSPTVINAPTTYVAPANSMPSRPTRSCSSTAAPRRNSGSTAPSPTSCSPPN